MKELYEKFYEQSELKVIRDLLDGGDASEISALVTSEKPSFTDYLNFFEFLAYLYESKQITQNEMRGMFDYYLGILRQNAEVRAYIKNPAKGFEKLDKVLAELE